MIPAHLVRLLAAAVLLAACGSDGDRPTAVAPAAGDGGPSAPEAPEDGDRSDPGPVSAETPGDGTAPDPAASRTRFRDTETGSLWNLRGEAFDGPLAGVRLEQVPAYSAYWFAWSSFWPDTDVWGQDDGTGTFRDGAFSEIPTREFVADLPLDAIPPLDDPPGNHGRARFVAAGAARLRNDDIVVGVLVDGDARAYPVGILNFHEIVNHTVGGRRVVVTYCPLTGSGVLFDAAYEFGNTGGLYNNNMVMYDRETRSFWSQMRASAILGDEVGSRLPMLPVVQGTWAAWRALYPDTVVLSPETGYSRPYADDIYVERGYTTSREIWFPQAPGIDGRYHPKDMTLGLVGEHGTRAYVFSDLEAVGPQAVVNDEFEGLSIVVVFDGEGRMAVPFSRRLADDRTLTFEGVR